jgi:hypothetical protein
LIAVNSVISGNLAIAGSESNGNGGGAAVEAAIITGSAIFGNIASFGGGMEIEGGSSASSIANSTISGNTSKYHGGGLILQNPTTISNVTIAFNTGATSGGLYLFNTTLTMESSILADNSDPEGDRSDLVISGSNGALSGSNNIITNSNVPFPPQTITVDPRLAPLSFHGGATPTHALLPTSPALNAGTNTLEFPFDQRDNGFPRTYGPTTDIGAYELQGIHDDEIFFDGFQR